ncbi:MAG: hypothetical protein ACTHN5_12185 [Phycisphaerae bacterium]
MTFEHPSGSPNSKGRAPRNPGEQFGPDRHSTIENGQGQVGPKNAKKPLKGEKKTIADALGIAVRGFLRDFGAFVDRTDAGFACLLKRVDAILESQAEKTKLQAEQEALAKIEAVIRAVERVERGITGLSNLTGESPQLQDGATTVLQETRQDLLVTLLEVEVEQYSAAPEDTFDFEKHSPLDAVACTELSRHNRIASQIRPGYRRIQDKKVIKKALVRVFDSSRS